MPKLVPIPVDSPFSPLEDRDMVIIGRSSTGHKRAGRKGLMYVGAVSETGKFHDRKVMVDARFPHIIFICGKRGSGKSYTLGVVAEELAGTKTGIGVVIVDPVGVFWSMKFPNRSKTERTALKQWGMKAQGLGNMKVMAPAGYFDELRETVDEPFSITVSDMTAEDWCSVFDIARFKVQGLLIGTALQKAVEGHRYLSPKGRKMRVEGRERYSIDDIITVVEKDIDILSRDRGFAPATRRSVIARFESAKLWGIFEEDGTSMDQISVPNQVTVIDVSHQRLGENSRALVVGILARKVLQARIQATRAEDAEIIADSAMTDETIPVTWLLIDEAHLMLPHKGDTPATSSLVEYAKLGRKPGCALVLATQRPAATNDDVLSQVDVMIGHNLALEDDITALRRRMPAKMPPMMADSDFIRGLPIGVGVLADQQTQNRSFVFTVRPRASHHAGRQAVPTDRKSDIAPSSRKRGDPAPFAGATFRPRENEPEPEDDGDEFEEEPEAGIPNGVDEVPEGDTAIPDEGTGEPEIDQVGFPDEETDEPAEPEGLPSFSLDELRSEGADEPDEEPVDSDAPTMAIFTPVHDREDMSGIAVSKAKGFMTKEMVESVEPVGLPLTKVTFRHVRSGLLRKKQAIRTILWDRMTGEVAKATNSGLRRSEGVPLLMGLSDDEVRLFIALKDPHTLENLVETLQMEGSVIERMLHRLKDDGLVRFEEDVYLQSMTVKFKLYSKEMPSVEQAPVLEELFKPTTSHKEIERMVGLLFKGDVIRLEDVLFPYYRVTYVSTKGSRVVYFDALSGTEDKFLTKFLL